MLSLPPTDTALWDTKVNIPQVDIKQNKGWVLGEEWLIGADLGVLAV